MNLNQQIKENRLRLSISQEELADKVFVTRQTISNWETGKNYPDIQSLLLLSSLFDVSLDALVKGDLEKMREIVDVNTIHKMKRLSNSFAVGMVLTMVSVVPLVYYLDLVGIIIWTLVVMITMIIAVRIEKIKKQYDIQTYREILAFMDGKKIDEIQKAEERGKRGYQVFFYALVAGGIALVVSIAMAILIMG